MPNTNTPVGLNPRKHAKGGLVRSSAYQIASGLASNIYRGSGVIPVNTTKRIDVAAAGNRLIGAFHGVAYVDSLGQPQYSPRWATGTTLKTGSIAEAYVFDDPDILFGIQVSSATGLVAADVGNFADLVIGTGSSITGNSGDMLDQTTLTATTATGGQLRIEELDPIEGNAYGQYAKALVRINEHTLGAGTTAGMNTNAV
jgi:hypothetical protein